MKDSNEREEPSKQRQSNPSVASMQMQKISPTEKSDSDSDEQEQFSKQRQSNPAVASQCQESSPAETSEGDKKPAAVRDGTKTDATSYPKSSCIDADRFSFREPFLEKLRLMLDSETCLDGGSIKWLDEEDGFVIMDRKKFEKETIPKYFTPIAFQSFRRKLYRWGFKRIPSNYAGSCIYASAAFKRNRSPVPSTTFIEAAGTTASLSADLGHAQFPTTPQNNLLEMLVQQQSAVNSRPNQLILSLLARLQQNTHPPVFQNSAFVNSVAQQYPIQILLSQQQIIPNQSDSILQYLLSAQQQQLVNQSMLRPPVYCLQAQAQPYRPLAHLNQDQLLNAFAVSLASTSSPEQAMALLPMSNIQNATSAVADITDNQATERGEFVKSSTPSRLTQGSVRLQRSRLPQSQSGDASSTTEPKSRRKRKLPHPSS